MPHAIRQGDIPGVQLRHEATFDATPADLWPWVIEPRLMRRWLAAEVEPLEAGGGWLLTGLDEEGGELLEEVRGVERRAGRGWRAVFERRDDGWQSATRLAVDLVGDGPTVLRVVQQGFERLNLSRCLTVWELYRRRWRAAFERLAVALADGDDGS